MIRDQCGLDIDIEDENGNLSAKWTLSSEYGDCTIDWKCDDPDEYNSLEQFIDAINDSTWGDMDEIADTPFGTFHRSDIEPRLGDMISSLYYVYTDGSEMQFTYAGLYGCRVAVGNEFDGFSMVEVNADKDTTLDEAVDDVEKQIREFVGCAFDVMDEDEVKVYKLVERLNEENPGWEKMIWDRCGLDIDIEDENGNLSAEWTLSSEYGDCTIDWTYDDPDDYDCLKLLIDTINDCTWCDMDEIADTPFGAFHRSDIEPRLETMISSLHYVYADGTVMQFTYDGLCGCDVQVGNEEDDFSMIEIRADKDTTLDEVVDDVEKQIREYVEGCFDLKGANE